MLGIFRKNEKKGELTWQERECTDNYNCWMNGIQLPFAISKRTDQVENRWKCQMDIKLEKTKKKKKKKKNGSLHLYICCFGIS